MTPRPQFRRERWSNLNGEWGLRIRASLGILQSSYTTNYTIIMAGGMLATVLPLALYLFAQRYIIEGVSRSGLNG